MCNKLVVFHYVTSHLGNMFNIDYLTTFEITLCNDVIMGLGFLCCFLKMFTSKDYFMIFNIVQHVSLSLMIFREIGQHKLEYDVWKPFIVSVLTQVSILILAYIFVLIKRGQHKAFTYFIVMLSCSFFNAEYYGVPLVQSIFGTEYTYVAILLYVVHSIILRPLSTFVAYLCIKENEVTTDRGSECFEEEEELEDGIDKGDPNHEPIDIEPSEEEKHEEEKKNETNNNSFGKILLWSIVSPQNIGFVLGVIWSATKVKMPTIIDSFTNDHEKALMAAGLFACGGMIYEHPFWHTSIAFETFIFTIIKLFIVPLIALGWSKLLKCDKTIQMIITLVYASPVGLPSYVLCHQYNIKLLSPTLNFVWTNLFSLPAILLWALIFNY